MTEWLKVHAWKACVQQCTGGSNPPLSEKCIFKKIGNRGIRSEGAPSPNRGRDAARMGASASEMIINECFMCG